MSHVRATLPVIEVEDPCPVDWDTMTGDEQARFCSHCNRHVHDLSAMRSDEVADLICRNAGELCVRFEQTADGQVRTLDYEPASRRPRLPAWLSRGFVGGFVAGIAALIVAPALMPTMGRMAPVRPTTPIGPLPATPPAATPTAAPASASDTIIATP